MRKLIWIAIGFACACGVAAYADTPAWLLAAAIFCVSLFLISCCIKADGVTKFRTVIIGFALGILCAGLFEWIYLAPVRKLDGSEMELRVEVSHYSYETQNSTCVQGVIPVDGRSYRITLYLKTDEKLSPGDTVAGTFWLRFTGTGGAKNPTSHRGSGIFLIGYTQEETVITQAERIPVRYTPVVLSEKILNLLDRLFPGDTAPFARALLLGEDSKLSYAQDKALQISGIRHVIAVSGLHISILFGAVYCLCGKRRFLTALIGIPVLVLFAAVVGFTPSIVRACIMNCLMILALLIKKEYDPPAALAFAVLVILGSNPNAISSVSFQLSVGCLIGIFLFARPLNQYFIGPECLNVKKGNGFWNGCKRLIAGSVSITLSTMVTTTPLCAIYFGTVSLVGILTNLVTLWLISAIFCGIIIACLLGVVWLPLGQCIAWLLSWPIRMVLAVCSFFSQLPMAAIYTENIYSILWLVFAYVLLAVFLLDKRRRPKLFAACLVLGLCASMLCGVLEEKQDGFRVTVMDVGQGQCILLQTEEEQFLVDCGSTAGERAADVAIRELLSRGITRLDGVIVTHYDKDHVSGVNALLSRIPAQTLYLPDTDADNNLRQEILREHADRVIWVREIQVLPVDDGQLTLFPAETDGDRNESSLCILFQPENYDILITGDRGIRGEAELLETVQLPKLELLVAGHHGSEGSTGLALLRQTMPATVVISVGEDNSYGHPSDETLERLELFDCRVLRTDQEGTITFRG